MRKLLVATIIIFGFLCIYYSIKYKHKKNIQNETSLPQMENKKPINKNIPVINKINEKNAKIRSVLLKSMPIKINNGNFTFRLTGDLAHEKEKNFRFIATSKLTGREMDLGSNREIFWFWSKRINPPALYFAKHEDLSKTNLKTPLNPSWMIESLNVGLVNQKNIHGFTETDIYLHLFEKRLSSSGEDCIFMTTINKLTENICSRRLTDSNGKVIVSTAYNDHITTIEWKDENVTMEWDTKVRQLNVDLPESMWKIPDYKKKINMAIE
jgi:hypothetical protein